MDPQRYMSGSGQPRGIGSARALPELAPAIAKAAGLLLGGPGEGHLLLVAAVGGCKGPGGCLGVNSFVYLEAKLVIEALLEEYEA